jgi:hypothetical protein
MVLIKHRIRRILGLKIVPAPFNYSLNASFVKLRVCGLLFILWGFGLNSLMAQFYSMGEAPAAIHWKQIKTPHFKIVYPRGLYDDASHFAITLEQNFNLSKEGYQRPLMTRFPILLYNTSVQSNGFVTLAPRRMEIITTPPQDSYAQDWISQLAYHEFRHVAQLNELNQGITRFFGWITGEISPGAVSSLIPSWYYEGDAVYNETRFSDAGRGRLPGFEMELRTQLLNQKKPYSYSKILCGSLKSFVPDQYCYGYQITGYARSRFGNEFWPEVVDYTSRHPYLVVPMTLYLKKKSGCYKAALYRQAMDSLKKQYINQEESIIYSNYQSINTRKNTLYTSYMLPKDLGSGTSLVMMKGLNETGCFASVDTSGNVKTLFKIGFSSKLKYDVSGSNLVWDEVKRDPRWPLRDYSVIRMADLKTGKRRTLTRKTRFFSPNFAPDGRTIAVAECDLNDRNYLTLLDAKTGEIIRRVATTNNRTLQTPEWYNDHEIVAVTVSKEGKQLEVFNLQDETWSVWLPFTRYNISEPVHFGNFILFRSAYQDIENIYAINPLTPGRIFQVTHSRYGAYNPAVSRDSLNLLFSNYGVEGFDICKIRLDTVGWKCINPKIIPEARWADKAVSTIQRDSLTIACHESSYCKAGHLFHAHSWLPFYTDLEEQLESPQDAKLTPGAILYTQNLLSTFISSIGYSYDQGYSKIIPTISWRGWYPVVELQGQLGGPPSGLGIHEGTTLPERSIRYYSLRLKTYIPLVYYHGSQITTIQPSVEYQRNATWYNTFEGPRRDIDYLHFKFSMFNYQQLSVRDIVPRWGQFLTGAFTVTPHDKGLLGSMFSVLGGVYLPGIAANHSIYFRGGWQIQDPEKYYISLNRVNFPRGYQSTVSKELTTFSANYTFPVAYPDLTAGTFVYVKRLRTNVFYDLCYGKDVVEITSTGSYRYNGYLRSMGAEFIADLHLFRIIFPLSAGVRIGYQSLNRSMFTEVILGIDTGIF